MSTDFLSIVMPAYNEEARLAATFVQLAAYFAAEGRRYELILVDDGSRDRTAQLAASLGPSLEPWGELRLLRNECNRGKGYSVRRGMLAARGVLALMTDADLSTPLDQLPLLERALHERDLDVAIGSRAIPGAQVLIHQSAVREKLGVLFNLLVRRVTGLPFRDTQCGFKLFRLATTREIFRVQRLSGWAFDVELLFIARRWGLRVEEVPVVWRHAEGSKVQVAAQAPRVLVDVLRIRLNNARGFYRRDQVFLAGEALLLNESEGGER
ncbi:MAG: glycosyltransferase family 2 protein [Acidobacteriota bacterium]